MYSKEEAAKLKTAFWTSLGQYMKPIPSAWKEKVNWLNYKTGIKDIYFRMQADNKKAAICIELVYADPIIRQIVFEQFELLKPMLEEATRESWIWQFESHNDLGKPISTIGVSINEVNIMKREDWPALISFFKPRLIALDQFWGDAKDIVEMSL